LFPRDGEKKKREAKRLQKEFNQGLARGGSNELSVGNLRVNGDDNDGGGGGGGGGDDESNGNNDSK
jgi:hypothetical protein